MKKKFNIFFTLFILLLIFGFGYAYLTTTLSINGTTDVDSNSWNIYWDNVEVKSGSVTGSQVLQAPTIDTNKTSVSFRVNLKKPGDYYEFTVDAKNDGSIDAMIDTITKTTSIPDYLNYVVTYDDGIEIENNQILRANSKEVYKIRVEYRTDINGSDLPSTSQSLLLTFGVTYVQADSNAVDVDHPIIVYTANTEYGLKMGQSIPNNITQYNTLDEAIARYNELFNQSDRFIAFKHILKDDKVDDSYIVFSYPEFKSGVYELRGFDSYNKNSAELCSPGYFDSTNNQCLSPYYENNKNILLNYFGSSNCNYNSLQISCYVSGTNGSLQINASTSGRVSVSINYSWYAQSSYDGIKYQNGAFW